MEQKIGTLKNCKGKERTIFLTTRTPPHKFVTMEVRGGREPETMTFPVEELDGEYFISAHTIMRIERKFTGHGKRIAGLVKKTLNK